MPGVGGVKVPEDENAGGWGSLLRFAVFVVCFFCLVYVLDVLKLAAVPFLTVGG